MSLASLDPDRTHAVYNLGQLSGSFELQQTLEQRQSLLHSLHALGMISDQALLKALNIPLHVIDPRLPKPIAIPFIAFQPVHVDNWPIDFAIAYLSERFTGASVWFAEDHERLRGTITGFSAAFETSVNSRGQLVVSDQDRVHVWIDRRRRRPSGVMGGGTKLFSFDAVDWEELLTR